MEGLCKTPYVVPECNKSLTQKVATFLCDQAIYLGVDKMASGDISVPVGTAVCSTAIMSKALMIRDCKGPRQAPTHYTIKDLEMIIKFVLQYRLANVIQSQMLKSLARPEKSALVELVSKAMADI